VNNRQLTAAFVTTYRNGVFSMRREIYTIRSGAVKGDLWVSARQDPTGDEWRKDIQKATYPSFDFMKNWKTDAQVGLSERSIVRLALHLEFIF
jgi:hypothetical protein